MDRIYYEVYPLLNNSFANELEYQLGYKLEDSDHAVWLNVGAPLYNQTISQFSDQLSNQLWSR